MEHIPVLMSECLEGLKIKPDGIYVDGTLGCGGHTRQIAKQLRTGRLIAIDRDAEIMEKTREQLLEHTNRITFVHGDFGDLSEILDAQGLEQVDGMLFDLGVSSPQLDNSERGFSYMQNAPLDMRMDRQGELKAFEVVNSFPEEELRRIFREYGEERYAGLIARAIVKKRLDKPINTTFDLSNVIFSAIPAAARREAQHPSKRCFQALRIVVNNELGSIAKMLDTAPDKLKPGARLCVISFHSLEDRLVKNSFVARANVCTCPRDFPICVCGIVPTLKIVTKKPIIPGDLETEHNPRARSAKLRIAERL